MRIWTPWKILAYTAPNSFLAAATFRNSRDRPTRPMHPVNRVALRSKGFFMNIFLVLLAFVAGAFMPVQAGINVLLRKVLGNPLQASLVSFFVGTVALGIWSLAARHSWPNADSRPA